MKKITFNKRKTGLLNIATELFILCNIKYYFNKEN